MADGLPDPVDWALAERIARRVAGHDPFASSYLGGSLSADFEDVTARAEELVADFTGLRAPARAHARVLDRPGWVSANVASMQRMLAPFTKRVAERMARSPFAPIGRGIAGTEMGVLLGYLSRRVLGQYDLLLLDDANRNDATDAVYYVGPNILGLEKRYAFRPRDFRLWIAIHEVTHRSQFTGVPWMKEYFLGLVEQSLGVVDPDPRRLVRALMRAADEIRKGRNPLDEGGLVGLLATPEQRGVLAQVQALMSLLEGHGNAVMNTLGARVIEGHDRMHSVLHARRQARGLNGQVQKLLGLEMKMRQYEVGERFIAQVDQLAGMKALDAAWVRPENLPTLQELDDPPAWLERVGQPATRR